MQTYIHSFFVTLVRPQHPALPPQLHQPKEPQSRVAFRFTTSILMWLDCGFENNRVWLVLLPRGMRSDVWEQIEVLVVFIRSTFAFADLLFGFNELNPFNPFNHLVPQLILHAQP